MENKGMKKLNKSELTKLNKSIVGVKYNKIIKGTYKGLYELTYLVNPEEVSMPVWTKEQKADLDERFGYVHEKFNEIDRRFEQVDKRFEQIDKRFEQVDKRFEQVDKRFEQVDKRIDKLEETMVNLFKINGFKTE